MNLKIQVSSPTGPVSCAQWPYMATGHDFGQHRLKPAWLIIGVQKYVIICKHGI